MQLKAEIENPSRELHAPITETIHKNDSHTDRFRPAKQKDIMNLIERATFAIVLRRETDENLNVLPSRFVLAIIRKEHGSALLKVRFVIGEHRNRWKSQLFYVQSNVRQTSVRMLLAIASVLGFEV